MSEWATVLPSWTWPTYNDRIISNPSGSVTHPRVSPATKLPAYLPDIKNERSETRVKVDYMYLTCNIYYYSSFFMNLVVRSSVSAHPFPCNTTLSYQYILSAVYRPATSITAVLSTTWNPFARSGSAWAT